MVLYVRQLVQRVMWNDVANHQFLPVLLQSGRADSAPRATVMPARKRFAPVDRAAPGPLLMCQSKIVAAKPSLGLAAISAFAANVVGDLEEVNKRRATTITRAAFNNGKLGQLDGHSRYSLIVSMASSAPWHTLPT